MFEVLSEIGGVERAVKLCIKVRRNDVGGFTAACPSLPGCVSAGLTAQQARENLEEAIRGYLASVNNFVPAHLHEMLVYQS